MTNYTLDQKFEQILHRNTIFVGFDVHKETISAAGIHSDTGEILNRKKFANELKKVKKYLRKLEKEHRATIKVCYEAGCMGYPLQREIEKWGYSCKIVAPSLTPVKPGDRIKTDRKDAEKLASGYLANQLTFVAVPDKRDEPARNLLRLKDVLRREILRSKHYLLKLALRSGFIYHKKNWTKEHIKWLQDLPFESELDKEVFQEYFILLEFKMQRIEEIERRIEEIARMPRYSEKVKVLSAFRGVGTYSAMVMLLETGAFTRFPKAGNYMKYIGLVPSEDSSGPREKRGKITRAGNSYCRHIMVQAALHYAKPMRTETLMKKLSGLPPWVSSAVVQAQQRLRSKYWRLARRKSPQIAVVAIARELAGFIWATMIRFEKENAERKVERKAA